MAATVPALVWQRITAAAEDGVTSYAWSNPSLTPGDASAVSCRVGDTLRATVLTMGSSSTTYTFPIVVNAGSDAFQLTGAGSLLDGSELQVGMPIIPTVEAAPPNGLPNGLVIVGINAPSVGSIELGGGYSPWLSGSGDAPWIYTQPATSTLSASLIAVDEYPYGKLAVTAVPSAGVTIVDWAFDGTGNDHNVGNGTAMCNSGGQAMGTFGATFADAGTYTLAVAYTSYDAAYSNGGGSLTVTVEPGAGD